MRDILKISDSVTKALPIIGKQLDIEAIEQQLINHINWEPNEHIHICDITTNWSVFKIIAVVTYHSYRNAYDSKSLPSSEYKLYVEQYVNGKQMTKLQHISHVETERESYTSGWSYSSGSLSQDYIVTNCY